MLLPLLLLVQTPAAPIDLELAERYLAEARRLAEADAGKLWGRSLAGPILLVDRASRYAVANEADREGHLRGENGLFVGTLPPQIPIANTAITWAGTRWTMLMWPLPKDGPARAVLLMHESWHRIQDDLQLPAHNPKNHHLDQAQPRYLLQLEWRALAKALATRGPEQREALADALVFRQVRQRDPVAAAEESALERNEALAEYTGVKLSGMADGEQRLWAQRKLEERPSQLTSFVRSFAYLSGPAYGLLLDEHRPDWRKQLKNNSDLGQMLADALALPIDPATAPARAERYGGAKLLAAELARERAREEKAAGYRKLLVDGPTLKLPAKGAQYMFDPRNIFPLGDYGTIYPTLTLMGPWGTLEVQSAALLSNDFQTAWVSAPTTQEQDGATGTGWELKLKEGWKLIPSEKEGSWQLFEANADKVNNKADRSMRPAW